MFFELARTESLEAVDDSQTIAAAILAGATGIAAAIRWAINRVVKSIDDSASANREVIKENTAALRDFSRDAALLKEKLADTTAKVDSVHEFIEDERSGVHEAPPQPPKRSTPIGGYSVQRGTRGRI